MEKIKKYIWLVVYYVLGRVSPQTLVSVHFRRSFGRWIDWKNPRDINEKIQWIKFNSDNSTWVVQADKYAVRDYIKRVGLGDMLIPLIGKWDKAEDIDWDTLPNQFVMKTNNGSGDALICTDKSRLDTKKWTGIFSVLLKRKFGTNMGEPHYDKMPPCIIAEQLMDCKKQNMPSTSLIDYKIWSFDGKPAYVWVCYNRTKETCDVMTFDVEWNAYPEYSVSKPHYVLSQENIPRPASLDKMLEAASILSKGVPAVRIDFYEVDGKAYFGELTFTPAAGLNNFYTQEFLYKLGDLCKL